MAEDGDRSQSEWETLKTRAAPGPPRPQELADAFPQLEILELLGQGGMGYVYKARQPSLDRLVALKLLPREVSNDRSFAERFAREARALARLSHPNIVMIHDSGQANGQYFLVMEFVDGLNLRQLLYSSDGRAPADKALQVVASVCDALEYAHDEGVIHRDIKPENILLDTKGRVKIADFGLAKLLGGTGDAGSRLTLSSPNQMLGTPHYMAPEQTEKPLTVDHRADIYAVGVVFYEMLTGELPIGRFQLPSELGRGDAALDDIVIHALAKDPERRYQRASEVKTAVESVIAGVSTQVLTPPPKAPPSPAADLSSVFGPQDILRARQRMQAPANWLIVAAIAALISLNPLGVITIIGAIKMKRLELRPLAIAGALCAILPYSICFPIGIIAGVWGLWVLTRPEVAAAFDITAAARLSGVGTPPAD